jgi:hypothetical protein
VESQFVLHPQQLKAFLSAATEILYGGAAGGGKSHLMRVAAILFCCQIPGLSCYLFRRTSPELINNHMEGPKSFPMLLAPMIAAGMCWIRAKKIVFWNGSRITLAHCQYENDIYKYQGAEIHLLLIDELTHWPRSMYLFLRGRLRKVGLEGMPAHLAAQFPKVICGSNPGNIGHAWVKKGWVDHGLQAWQTPAIEGGMIRRYIPAQVKDNPSLMEDDPAYIQRLQGLGDPLLVRAMLTGDWKIVAGSMFGDVWRDVDDRGQGWHVIKPFPIPAGWEIWRGADDGYGAPFAGYWLTRNPDTRTFFVIAELYKTMLTPEGVAELVRKRDLSIELDAGLGRGQTIINTHTLDGLLDSAAFSKTGASTKSRGEQMNDLGCKWKPVEKWPGSRVQRVQNLHRLLQPSRYDPDRRPGIQFFNTCINAIELIPSLPRDKNNQEDVDDNAEDHAFDGVTYGVQRKIGRRGPMKILGT